MDKWFWFSVVCIVILLRFYLRKLNNQIERTGAVPEWLRNVYRFIYWRIHPDKKKIVKEITKMYPKCFKKVNPDDIIDIGMVSYSACNREETGADNLLSIDYTYLIGGKHENHT